MSDATKDELPVNSEILTDDEGGLRAPPHLKGWRKWWWWFDFIILVKLARLRFIGILLIIGLMITKWDLLLAYYDRFTRPAVPVSSASSGIEWFCPMHPAIVRDNPKEKCPICFMPLSKRKKGDDKAEALPAGVVSRVQLSPYRVVLAGVETWDVSYVPLTKDIEAVGYVEFNERGQRTISARFNGRIDELNVNETGRMVEQGEVLASLYSPEVVVAMKSLLDAKSANNETLLSGTKTRLRLLGISDQQMDEILTSGGSQTQIKIRSPVNGHIIRKYVNEGQYVTEGMPLFDVADLTTVWIQAQVYQDDLLFLPESLTDSTGPGTVDSLAVVARTKALPNEEFHGFLTFVYPHVDQQTRTVTVRFELANPHHKLRPGSTATVVVQVPPERWALFAGMNMSAGEQQDRLKQGELLAVPQSSVIDTGSQKIVYHEVEPGVYEGVLVKLGPKMTGKDGITYFPVLDGLKAGMKVLSSGSFLVDAETRLNPSAGSIYFGGSGGSSSRNSVTTVRPTTPEDPDAKLRTALSSLSSKDREAVELQRFCPILTQNRLGSMGTPVKVNVGDEDIFLCCEGCRDKVLSAPDKTLESVKQLRATKISPPSGGPLASNNSKEELAIRESLSELTPADRAVAESQRFCPVLPKNRLGSMGPPVKLTINDKPVFLCCDGCKEAALKDPAETAAKAKMLTGDHHD